jgi:hypothetical protein
MSSKDKFTYKEGDLEVRRSYCEFCRFYIKGNTEACGRYPEGKPEDIKSITRICTYFAPADRGPLDSLFGTNDDLT